MAHTMTLKFVFFFKKTEMKTKLTAEVFLYSFQFWQRFLDCNDSFFFLHAVLKKDFFFLRNVWKKNLDFQF